MDEVNKNGGRICIQARRIFDASIKQIHLENYTVSASNNSQAEPALPLRYENAVSLASRGILSSTNISAIRNGGGAGVARVRAELNIPVEITYVDSNNITGKCTGLLQTDIDVVMTVPRDSVVPYEVDVTANLVGTKGSFVGSAVIDDRTVFLFNIGCCLTLIIKIVSEVDLIIQSCGYCVLPQAKDYSEAVCERYFNTPLFPD